MFARSLKSACLGLLLVGASALPAVAASGTDTTHLTYLTFTQTVTLPGGIQLPPGKYRFEVAGQTGVVRISDMGETIYLTAFTREVSRSDSAREAIVTLEKRTNAASPIAAWYPIGASQGYQFIYGK